METQRQTQTTVARAKAQETPEVDPGFALLVAVVAVLLALALGTAIFALAPITL